MENYELEGVMDNLKSYLESHNINTSRLFHCLNPNHRDSNASMKYFDDGRCYCFGCGVSYNLVDVIGIMENLDNRSAFKKTMQYYGKNFDYNSTVRKDKEQTEKDYTKAYNVWSYNLRHNKEAMDYLLSRGLSKKVIKDYKLGFNSFDFKEFKFNAVVIPVSKNCFAARNIHNDEKLRYYKPKGCQVELFNTEALTNNSKYCVITEGEFDCLSFETVGVNAIGLSSANNVNKFIEREKSLDKTFILALDNDEAGQIATKALIEYFDENNINYCTFDNCGYKDANQALVSDKEKFTEEINKIVFPLIKEREHRKAKQFDDEME